MKNIPSAGPAGPRPLFIVILFLAPFLAAACGGSGATAGNAPANRETEAAGAETAPAHPDFRLSREELFRLAGGLPPDAAAAVRARPGEFLGLAAAVLDLPQDILVLVDKNNPLPETYEPGDLRPLRDTPVSISRPGLMFREAAIPALLAMAEAARREGVELLASSAYRSYSYQKTVHERIVRELGREQAERESARPGHSQHQLGTAVDFGSISDAFTGTPMQRWLMANAGKFGFSLSYPEGKEDLTGYRHESWHYRYIGPAAAVMEGEFFGGLQQRFLEFWKTAGPVLRAARLRRK